MPKKITVSVDGKKIKVDAGKSILDICKGIGIKIPTLCYHRSLFPEARCRVCLVEQNGHLVTSCATKPSNGDVILTKTPRIFKARKLNLELMNPGVKMGDLTDDFEAKEIYDQIGLENERFKPRKEYHPDLGAAIIRDNNKCVNCGKCVNVCSDIQQIYAIDFSSRAHDEHVTPYNEKHLAGSSLYKVWTVFN